MQDFDKCIFMWKCPGSDTQQNLHCILPFSTHVVCEWILNTDCKIYKSSQLLSWTSVQEKFGEYLHKDWKKWLDICNWFFFFEKQSLIKLSLLTWANRSRLNCLQNFLSFSTKLKVAFSESAIRFSNLQISKKQTFQITILSLKFEFVVYCYWREI